MPFGDLAHDRQKASRNVGLIAGAVLGLLIVAYVASIVLR
jgi:hypothetical protein